MPPARATYTDSDIRLPLALVKREQVFQKLAESPQGLFHLGPGLQILNHTPVVPGKLSELGHKVGIREMAHVKEQFHRARAPVLVAEAQDLYAHGSAARVRAEALDQQPAKRVNSMLGGVYDVVGQSAYVFHSI